MMKIDWDKNSRPFSISDNTRLSLERYLYFIDILFPNAIEDRNSWGKKPKSKPYNSHLEPNLVLQGIKQGKKSRKFTCSLYHKDKPYFPLFTFRFLTDSNGNIDLNTMVIDTTTNGNKMAEKYFAII